MDLDDKLFKDRRKIKEEVENFLRKACKMEFENFNYFSEWLRKKDKLYVNNGLIPIEKGCFGIGAVFFQLEKQTFL